MKKVLILTANMAKGGMERQLSTFLNKFDRSKLSITLALFRDNIEYDLPSDVEVIKLNKKGSLDIGFSYNLYRLIKNGGFEVVNSKISGVNEYAMIICGILKRKLIIELRSSGIRQFKYYKRISFLSNFFGQKWTVICNSDKAHQELKERITHDRLNIITIKNGIDTSVFSPKKISDISIPSDFHIGFVGRIAPIKNLETLIRAVSNINKEANTPLIDLTILGEVRDSNYFKELQELIPSSFQGKVVFLSPIEEVPEFYNSIDLLVLPSHQEGTPNVLLEAMSCGCFCIISKGANSDNFLTSEFEFETSNEKELAKRILWSYNIGSEKRKKIGENNREYVIKNYSVENMVNELTQLLLKS